MCFAIAPNFTERLIDKVREALCFVVIFDELLNSICQEGQRNIIVHYFCWDNVVSHYLESQLLGPAIAEDIPGTWYQSSI